MLCSLLVTECDWEGEVPSLWPVFPSLYSWTDFVADVYQACGAVNSLRWCHSAQSTHEDATQINRTTAKQGASPAEEQQRARIFHKYGLPRLGINEFDPSVSRVPRVPLVHGATPDTRPSQPVLATLPSFQLRSLIVLYKKSYLAGKLVWALKYLTLSLKTNWL